MIAEVVGEAAGIKAPVSRQSLLTSRTKKALESYWVGKEGPFGERMDRWDARACMRRRRVSALSERSWSTLPCNPRGGRRFGRSRRRSAASTGAALVGADGRARSGATARDVTTDERHHRQARERRAEGRQREPAGRRRRVRPGGARPPREVRWCGSTETLGRSMGSSRPVRCGGSHFRRATTISGRPRSRSPNGSDATRLSAARGCACGAFPVSGTRKVAREICRTLIKIYRFRADRLERPSGQISSPALAWRTRPRRDCAAGPAGEHLRLEQRHHRLC